MSEDLNVLQEQEVRVGIDSTVGLNTVFSASFSYTSGGSMKVVDPEGVVETVSSPYVYTVADAAPGVWR